MAVATQNDHILDRMQQAELAVEQLVARGFTVLSVKVEDRNPLIWIQHSARCNQLDGGVHVITQGPRGREEVMAATFEGCQVQWRNET